jgi:hypothetical protein
MSGDQLVQVPGYAANRHIIYDIFLSEKRRIQEGTMRDKQAC